LSGPDSTAVTMPPTPTAAVNSPSVRGSPPNRSALSAGRLHGQQGRDRRQGGGAAEDQPPGVDRVDQRPAEQADRQQRPGSGRDITDPAPLLRVT
jgi:hypothetical protein